MKVRIFRDWRTSYRCDFDYKDIKIVNDDSYDYAILFNTPRASLKLIPKKHVIGFAWEPWGFRNYKPYADYARKHVGAYLIGVPLKRGSHLGSPFVEHHAFMYDCRPVTPQMDIGEKKPFYDLMSSYDNPLERKHPMCMIATAKRMLPGHQKRLDLVDKILRSKLNIHIYGRTIGAKFKGHDRIKGGFGLHYQVYPKYYFDISIENCREGSYITEKLWNPASHKTCPIYWGSSKVKKYTSDFYFKLPENNDDAMDFLKLVSENPQKYYDEKALALYNASDFMRDYNYLDFAKEYFTTGKLPEIII